MLTSAALLPVLASLALALTVAVAPSAPGAHRLIRLTNPGRTARSAGVPMVVTTAVGAVLGLLALGPAGALVGGAGAATWRRGRARAQVVRTAMATAGELADALGRITEELRAGAHPAAALGGTATDGPRARAVLAAAGRAAALGDDVAAALVAAAARHPGVAPDLHRVARTWALADRHGVPAADLLASVLTAIRWRLAHTDRVRAQLAGPRATAAVLTALPGLGLALGELIGAAPLTVLRSGVLGQLLVVVGVGLGATGAAWTAHILRVAAT